MISTDPPKHTRLRSLVNRGFTPRAVAKAEASVRTRAREIVDAIAPKGEVEFVSEVSSVLPVAIICDMMGVPEPDRARMLDLTNRLLGGGDEEYGGNKESLQRAGAELRDYGLWLAKSRLAEPKDDITSALVHAEVEGEALPPEDLGPFILLLIAAGNETTRTAISHGLLALTEFPDQKRVWLEDLDGRANTAAEEIVRWATPVLHMRRTVTRDTEVAGTRMREGDKVAMWYVSANRDEEQFVDPHRFDVRREPNEQGGFGTGGAHFCLGAHLARRELIVMLTELLRRLPDIEVSAKPEKLRSNFIHGIKRMPARFTPAPKPAP
jgi:cytochrome P450